MSLDELGYRVEPLSQKEAAYIGKKLGEYLCAVVPPEAGTPGKEQIVFMAVDAEGCFAGGCIVNIHEWGRAVLATLWVDERHRTQGLGSLLIRAAERCAREKGCYIMCLGTVDYMARPLYEKHGYVVFTINQNVPRGHESYSMVKRLDRDDSDYTPSSNSAPERYVIERGGAEDAKAIEDGLSRYCALFVPEGHEYIDINRKLVNEDGTLVAGAIAGVDDDDEGVLELIWVDEPYRNQGLGSLLLREIEREEKEHGAYVLNTNAGDWNVSFFEKNGFALRGELEDYPKGHRSFELTKPL